MTSVQVGARPTKTGAELSGSVVPLSGPAVTRSLAAGASSGPEALTPVAPLVGAAVFSATASGWCFAFLPRPRAVTRVPYRSARSTPMLERTSSHSRTKKPSRRRVMESWLTSVLVRYNCVPIHDGRAADADGVAIH